MIAVLAAHPIALLVAVIIVLVVTNVLSLYMALTAKNDAIDALDDSISDRDARNESQEALAEAESDLKEAEKELEGACGELAEANGLIDYAQGVIDTMGKTIDFTATVARNTVENLTRRLEQVSAVCDAQSDALLAERTQTALLEDRNANQYQTISEYIDRVQEIERTTVPVAELARLTNAVAAYDEAADKFIAKVEGGRARSTETYKDLVACREWNAPDALIVDQFDSSIDGVGACAGDEPANSEANDGEANDSEATRT